MSDLKWIVFLVSVVGIFLIFMEGAARQRPSPRVEPTSYDGLTLVWDLAKSPVPKLCQVITVDIDPGTPSRMRVEKDGPDCVNASVIFRLPLNWDVTGATLESIPYPDVIHPNPDETPHPRGGSYRDYLWVPGRGVAYWAFWDDRYFMIVYDSAPEKSE